VVETETKESWRLLLEDIEGNVSFWVGVVASVGVIY